MSKPCNVSKPLFDESIDLAEFREQHKDDAAMYRAANELVSRSFHCRMEAARLYVMCGMPSTAMDVYQAATSCSISDALDWLQKQGVDISAMIE